MQPWMFFVWVFIASIQIILFFNFLKNSKKNDNSIDIIPLVVYNNMVYWKNGSQLCRTKNSKNIDISQYEVVDPLNSDISPIDVLDILEALENG